MNGMYYFKLKFIDEKLSLIKVKLEDQGDFPNIV
jgi:hypothetical protein